MAVVAAVLILIAGWTPFDAIASLLIVVIIPGAGSLLREVVDVLLEATPHGVDLAEVREHIKRVCGVVDVHDLHAWTITTGVPVLSAHVIVDHACINEAAPVRCWTGSANAWVGTSTSLAAPSSSSRLALKSMRPPTTHDQSSVAEGPAEARGTTMTGSRERRTRRAETPPSSTRRIGP